jgi:repressor LexA
MLGDKIKSLRKRDGISQKALAQTLGVSQSTVAMWENGKNTPEYGTLMKLSEVFNVSLDDITGNSSANVLKSVPVLGYVRAGVPTEAAEEVLDYEEIYIKECDHSDYFALQIQGDSMSPRMMDGDIVIVKRQFDCENGDICVAMINDCETTVKKLIKKDLGIILMPLNPSYEPIVFTNDTASKNRVSILGKVVELRAKI